MNYMKFDLGVVIIALISVVVLYKACLLLHIKEMTKED